MARTHVADAAAAAAVRTQFSSGLGWARGGFERVRADPPLWLGMSALYLIPAALLAQLPFAGPLLVVLLSPMLLAGALLAAERPASAPDPTAWRNWTARPARELMRALADGQHVYPTVLLAIVTLGLVVIAFIVEHVFGGSLSALRSATAVGKPPSASLLLGVLITGLLQVLLLMALFYAVHRVLLARRDPLTAMEDSFKACVRHGRALTALTSVYLIPYLVIAGAFGASRWFGYVVMFTVGLVALPALVLATHRSYGEVFPAAGPG